MIWRYCYICLKYMFMYNQYPYTCITLYNIIHVYYVYICISYLLNMSVCHTYTFSQSCIPKESSWKPFNPILRAASFPLQKWHLCGRLRWRFTWRCFCPCAFLQHHGCTFLPFTFCRVEDKNHRLKWLGKDEQSFKHCIQKSLVMIDVSYFHFRLSQWACDRDARWWFLHKSNLWCFAMWPISSCFSDLNKFNRNDVCRRSLKYVTRVFEDVAILYHHSPLDFKSVYLLCFLQHPNWCWKVVVSEMVITFWIESLMVGYSISYILLLDLWRSPVVAKQQESQEFSPFLVHSSFEDILMFDGELIVWGPVVCNLSLERNTPKSRNHIPFHKRIHQKTGALDLLGPWLLIAVCVAGWLSELHLMIGIFPLIQKNDTHPTEHVPLLS